MNNDENISISRKYSDSYKKALGDKNIIVDANVGHVPPCFTFLNGSLGTVTYKNKELRIKQELMYEDNG